MGVVRERWRERHLSQKAKDEESLRGRAFQVRKQVQVPGQERGRHGPEAEAALECRGWGGRLGLVSQGKGGGVISAKVSYKKACSRTHRCAPGPERRT